MSLSDSKISITLTLFYTDCNKMLDNLFATTSTRFKPITDGVSQI